MAAAILKYNPESYGDITAFLLSDFQSRFFLPHFNSSSILSRLHGLSQTLYQELHRSLMVPRGCLGWWWVEGWVELLQDPTFFWSRATVVCLHVGLLSNPKEKISCFTKFFKKSLHFPFCHSTSLWGAVVPIRQMRNLGFNTLSFWRVPNS